ncbi:MAG: ADP-ribosylglycohydrolase family protein [Phycicoccus sp.]
MTASGDEARASTGERPGDGAGAGVGIGAGPGATAGHGGTSAPGRVGRAAGALLGVHAGDALGAAVEFSSREEVAARHPGGLWEIVGGGPFDWPAGHATDDTDLTRAVLLAYLERPSDVIRAAADHMLAWLDGDWPGRVRGTPPRDAGGATSTGLGRYRQTSDPRAAGAGAGQAGNGSLMRCIPTAVAVRDPARRVVESVEISAITHDDPRCTVACAAYNEIAAGLIAGEAVDAAVEAGVVTARRLGEDGGLGAAQGSRLVVEAIVDGRSLRLPELAEGRMTLEGDGRGYVLDSLRIAVAALVDPRPFADAVVDVVRIGNDTDTNAAIAGGLLGARDGASAIPPRWVATLQFADEFTRLAAVLVGVEPAE